MADRVDALSRALLESPPEGGPSFLTRAMLAVTVWERSGWLMKSGTRLILTIGAVASAVVAFKIGLWEWMGWQ
jgi:hypothetical protein